MWWVYLLWFIGGIAAAALLLGFLLWRQMRKDDR